MEEIADITLKSVIGFNGAVSGGLVAHPDGQHIVYPMGAKLAIQNWETGEQSLLEGHTSNISAVAISPCGKYLASGQILQPPFQKASVCMWSFDNRTSLGKHQVHGSSVRGLSFSCDSHYVYSVGGLEDHCLAVWDMKTSTAISCKRLPKALQSSEGMAIASARGCSNYVITSSEEGIKVWEMEMKKHQLNFASVNFGKIRRSVNCMLVEEDDSFLYCGTTTGDVVKVRLNLVPSPPRPVLVSCLAKPPPKKRGSDMVQSQTTGNYAFGVRALVRIDAKHLAIAAGDGTIDLVEELVLPSQKIQAGQKMPTLPAFKVKQTNKLTSIITSLTKFGDTQLLVGTKSCDIFSLSLADLKKAELHITCHPSPVYSLALPKDTSEVFVTSGYGDLRIWRVAKKPKKLLEVHRITRPGLRSRNVLVTQDGSTIISAWDDGLIRGYAPESGKKAFEILGAHRSGVSALGITSTSDRIVSGGREGQVRVWDCKGSTWALNKVFAEQRGTISQIAIKENDDLAASACEDGTCFIWSILQGQDVSCKQSLQVGSKLSAVCFIPGPDAMLLTTGADRRIVCWDTLQGVALRELETHAPITCLHVPSNGRQFVTGFEDGVVKVWSMLRGIAICIGQRHGAPITCVAMSSDGRDIISASEDGAIFTWDCPEINLTKGPDKKAGDNSPKQQNK